MLFREIQTVALTFEDIRGLAMFEPLDDPLISDIHRQCHGLKFAKNTAILGHLEHSNNVYLILDGEIRVNMVTASGRQITYQILGAGQMIGELSAIDGLPRSANAIAETEVTLAEMDGQFFIRLTKTHAALAFVVMCRLANMSRSLTSKVFEYHAFNVKGRVYSELKRNARLSSVEPALVRISDQDMASRVGTTRENVSRIYRELREEGVMERTSKGINIRNSARLSELIEECEFG